MSDYTISVSPNGDDAAAPGSGRPLATLAGAFRRLRALRRAQQLAGPAVVELAGGVYPLAEPVVLTPDDAWPVTVRSRAGETATLSGGTPVTKWTAGKFNGRAVWTAPLPDGLFPRSLFVGGQRATRARWPKRGFLRTESRPAGFEGPAIWCGRLADGWVARPGDFDVLTAHPGYDLADTDAVFHTLWVDDRLPLTAYDPATRVARVGVYPTHPLKATYDVDYGEYYLDHVAGALSEPGEFFADRRAGRLYYAPRRGEDMSRTGAWLPRLTQLLRLDGDPARGRYVEHLRFENLVFAHTDWTPQPEARRAADGSPWTACGAGQAACNVPGVISLRGARHVGFERCRLEHLGHYAFFVGDGCDDVRLAGNLMTSLGAGGVRITGSDAHGPEPGRTRRIVASDNEIRAGGRAFAAAAGILLQHAADCTLAHNHIHDLYYSGISIGWVWGDGPSVTRNLLVEKNHIHHLGQGLLSDMGGVYALGPQPGTIVRGNHIHDIAKSHYGGWCLYTDEGSAHLVLEDNLCHHTNSEVFHQHYGRENVVRNNIFAFGDEAIVRLTRVDAPRGEKAFTLAGNILLTDGAPVYATTGFDARPFLADGNWIGRTRRRRPTVRNDDRPEGERVLPWAAWRATGQDGRSVVADPGFRNAGKGDFRFAAGARPVREGFRPLDLSDVGPRVAVGVPAD